MITIHELLDDPKFKEFFLKPPPMPRVYREQALKPWRLYVQRETGGRWSKKDCSTYTEAFRLFKVWRPQAHDAAIVSKAVAFAPPSRRVRIKNKFVVGSDGVKRQATKAVPWRMSLPDGEGIHDWCVYCRRPTIFRYFSSHHAFPKNEQFDIASRRCTICGCRLDGMPRVGSKR